MKNSKLILALSLFFLLTIVACSKSTSVPAATDAPSVEESSTVAPPPPPAAVPPPPPPPPPAHKSSQENVWHDADNCTYCHIKHNHNEHDCAGPCPVKRK